VTDEDALTVTLADIHDGLAHNENLIPAHVIDDLLSRTQAAIDTWWRIRASHQVLPTRDNLKDEYDNHS